MGPSSALTIDPRLLLLRLAQASFLVPAFFETARLAVSPLDKAMVQFVRLPKDATGSAQTLTPRPASLRQRPSSGEAERTRRRAANERALGAPSRFPVALRTLPSTLSKMWNSRFLVVSCRRRDFLANFFVRLDAVFAPHCVTLRTSPVERLERPRGSH